MNLVLEEGRDITQLLQEVFEVVYSQSKVMHGRFIIYIFPILYYLEDLVKHFAINITCFLFIQFFIVFFLILQGA